MRNEIEKVFDDLWKNSIGVDNLMRAHRIAANSLSKTSGFPPYNIRKTGENTYQIEMAVAGFSISDIEITLEKNILKICSKGHDTTKDEGQFIHQGFAYRAFDRCFTLMDNVEVQNAELINGILKIYLESMLPEEDKPKRINISAPSSKSHPQLLNEDSSF
jgi:molecular chaperone IbpA